MKFVEILKEEVKKSGLEVGEEVLEAVVAVITDHVIPRAAIEADEAVVKGICIAAIPVLAALKPVIEKATDLNHDGK